MMTLIVSVGEAGCEAAELTSVEVVLKLTMAILNRWAQSKSCEGGIAWRLLLNDLPPKSTVFRWFATWRDNGLFEAINHSLVMADR